MTNLLPFGIGINNLNLATYVGPVMLSARSIGGLIADATLEERHLDTLAITDHPVERNAVISDHAFMLPFEVVIRAGWSDSSRNAGGVGYIQNIYAQLQQLQQIRQPFTILTGKRIYQNMLIHRLLTETSEATEHSLIVTVEARQIIIVSTQVAQGTPNNVQANPQDTGSTNWTGTNNPVQVYGPSLTPTGGTNTSFGTFGPGVSSFNPFAAEQSLPGYNF